MTSRRSPKGDQGALTKQPLVSPWAGGGPGWRNSSTPGAGDRPRRQLGRVGCLLRHHHRSPRQVNPELQDLKAITAAKGDSL